LHVSLNQLHVSRQMGNGFQCQQVQTHICSQKKSWIQKHDGS
jgi:hypothetical protein